MVKVSKKTSVFINTMITFSILYFLLLILEYSDSNLVSSEEKVEAISFKNSEYESTSYEESVLNYLESLTSSKFVFPNISNEKLSVEDAIGVLKVDLYKELTLDLDMDPAYQNLELVKSLIEENGDPERYSFLVGGKNRTIGDAIPYEDTKKILIATTWRSGSSFLGDLLNHYPGT